MFYRHSSMKTLQMSKSFKLLQSPILMQNRHLSDDSYTQLILHYTMAYAENSIMAKGFVYSYQAIGSVSCLECTGGVIGAALALRLLTFPLFALSEKLVAKRMIANQLIRRQVYEDAAAHYGEKAVVDPKTGRMTLALPDKLTNYENMKRNTKLEKIEELCYKTQYQYAVENKLQLHRILSLKICTFPLWMHTAIALRTSIDLSNSGKFIGFLWVPSFSQADPYMILPLAFCALSFLNLYSGKLMYVVPMQSTLRRLFIYTMTGVTCAASIGITYVLTQMPAIQSLYMCTLLFTAVAQTLALRHPRVKQLLGIGRLPTDSKTPFRDLFKGRRKVMPSTVV
ncbi:hypothetical protein ACQ4LE_003201 [Meloidogyne hapla]